MTTAELKIQLFRLIDAQEAATLRRLYDSIVEQIKAPIVAEPMSDLEQGYAAMAVDAEREAEALEWIEGTMNQEEL